MYKYWYLMIRWDILSTRGITTKQVCNYYSIRQAELHGMKLGRALCDIRLRGTYSEHRAELEAMGVKYGTAISCSRQPHGWDKAKAALTKYKAIHKDCLVPTTFVVPSDSQWPAELHGMKLGIALKNIRLQGMISGARR
jgi:hypothetical protein